MISLRNFIHFQNIKYYLYSNLLHTKIIHNGLKFSKDINMLTDYLK